MQGRTTPAQERTGGLRSILFCELLVGRNTAQTSVTKAACEPGAVSAEYRELSVGELEVPAKLTTEQK